MASAGHFRRFVPAGRREWVATIAEAAVGVGEVWPTSSFFPCPQVVRVLVHLGDIPGELGNSPMLLGMRVPIALPAEENACTHTP